MKVPTGFAIVLSSAVLSLSAAAADPPDGRSRLPVSSHVEQDKLRIWERSVGAGFRKHSSEAAVSVGAGFSTRDFGGSKDHNLALATLHYGWMLSGVMAADRWYAGNWEIAGELAAGAQFRPHSADLVSLCPLLRYNFATGTRWVPFVNGGAGVAFTDIGLPDLGTRFEFHDQGGGGVHWFFRDTVAATFQYRFNHFSNADIAKPNHGVNNNLFSLGVSWFF